MSKQVTCLWHGSENRNLCGRAVEVGQGEDRGAYWVASSECAHARAERRRTVRRKVSGGVSRIWVSQRGRDGETCGKLKGKFLSSAASSRWTLQVQLYWTSRERLTDVNFAPLLLAAAIIFEVLLMINRLLLRGIEYSRWFVEYGKLEGNCSR